MLVEEMRLKDTEGQLAATVSVLA